MGRRDRAGRTAFALLTVVLVAWGLRWLWGGELPPGVDTTGHLTRLDVGLDLFASFRLDGWFDRAMLGYQTHLMYGPGLAFAVAAVRTLSLGLVSIPGAYEIVAVVAYLAVPFTTAALARALGLPTGAARVAGLLALAVSSTRGGGLQGAFDLGLMPNHLAVPLVLGAWALMLHERQRPVLLGATVAAILVTHPQSLAVMALFTPFVLAAGWACGVVDRQRWRDLAAAASVAVGISAWWWIPAVVNRDLRGVMTGWDLPRFGDHLGLIIDGERGWIGWASVVVVATWAAAAAWGILRRDRRVLALVLLPIATLGSLHLVEHLFIDRFYEVTMFPNRGLAYACYLAAPVAGLVVHAVLGRVPALALLATALVVVVSVETLRPPDSTFDRPVDGMRAAADTLAEVVPDGQRFAYVESDVDRIGVPAPGRWLGWASGVPNLGPFGAEYAPGVGPTLMVFDPPSAADVDDWVARIRVLGVSHLVAGDVDTAQVLDGAIRLELVVRHEPVTIWVIEPGDEAWIVAGTREHLEIELPTAAEGPALVPLGYSPGWSATIDGTPVGIGRTDDGRATVVAPGGTGRSVVELDWSEPAGHTAGRWITAVTLLVLVGRGTRWRWADRGGRLRR